MTQQLLIPALAAAALLSGCNKLDQGNASAEQNETAAAPIEPISLPPAIIATKTYRCKDNSLVYIEWLAGGLSANFRAAQTDAPTQLTAAEAGAELVAEGYSLKGDATAKSITLTRSGAASQTCHS